MNGFAHLLACPSCGGPLAPDWRCRGCGVRFEAGDGVPNLRLPGDSQTEEVRDFYERAPFPGYPARDSLEALRARAGRSRFAQLLDHSIAGDAQIAEIGCGTGQMSLFLARGDRVVVGADLAGAALRLGHAAAHRYGVDRVLFVETDLHRPGLKRGAFDVIYSAGVLHHTPDPRAAFARLVDLVRPGGFLVVGVYNLFARIPLRLRRAVARWSRTRVVPFDPVLRDRATDPSRRDAWLRDQYQHPLEHSHTIHQVRGWFRERGVEYFRSYPSAVFDDESPELFAKAEDDWPIEAWLAQLGWLWTLGHEGGLFFSIGRRDS